jgi:multidrug efflux pump subunit AcrB
VDVRIQLDPAARQNASQLQQVPLFTTNNRPVRLADVSTIREGRAPGEIQRINQRQVFLLLGSLERGASLSEALKQTEQAIAAIAQISVALPVISQMKVRSLVLWNSQSNPLVDWICWY